MQIIQKFTSPKTQPRVPVTVEAKPIAREVASEPSGGDSHPQTVAGNAANAALQAMDIDPVVVTVAVILNFFLTTIDAATLEMAYLFSLMAAYALAKFSFHVQMEKRGDSRGMASAKACVLFVLLAAPSPFFTLLSVPSGIAGFIRNAAKK
jgi:hypothetical protein